MIWPILAAMRERGVVEEAVFMPFRELRADFLHNGFGVYILEFHDYSLLNDDNATRLLLLNEMPAKYELSLMIETEAVTDSSIDVLSQLQTVDYLYVEKSGLSSDGIMRLQSLLPDGTVAEYYRQSGCDNHALMTERANRRLVMVDQMRPPA
tara:strand:- start:1759 stop:2214 length:456 start_codon:yes stop_codon:yes gene_type:complete